ncbi:MAG: signal peptidase II [Candidatus Peribacteraceae bacterium]
MRIFFAAAVAALVASYFTWHYAEEMVGAVVLIEDFLSLRLHHNAGVAFGIRLPGGAQTLLIHLALVLVFILAIRSDRDLLQDTGYGLILGGALANIIDRAPDGLVTDYFSVGAFPIFNVPDVCITIGVLFIVFTGLRKGGLKE